MTDHNRRIDDCPICERARNHLWMRRAIIILIGICIGGALVIH